MSNSFLCLACVRQANVAVVQQCGNYSTILGAGPSFIMWPLQNIAGTMSLRIQQLDVVCETKTKDNVFVQVAVSIQYKVVEERVYDAFYKLTDPAEQIRSYVYDVVRSSVPRLELDQAFSSKTDIAQACQDQLKSVMSEYGYEILESLVTDLSPDMKVKASMNEINASKRLKMASMHKAEADKIKQVKAAEAEAEARYLSGMGVARQRKAIVDGLKQSINDFKADVKGTQPRDVMDLLLLTQYFDLLRDVGANSLFLDHEPQAVARLQMQVNGGFMKTKKGMMG